MPESNNEFDGLLEYLKRTRGFDFTSYKSTSLTRRIQTRMEALGLDGFAGYQDYLEVHPDEFAHLFNTVLINVTSFFRDTAAWEYLAAETIPRIIADKGGPGSAEPIRVWSAGCASGEEAYTAAILLVEQLGPEAFQSRVKIYATDISDGALSKARQASYGPREVEGVPPAVLARHFRQIGNVYTLDPELRRCVVFGRHDLVQDSPISKIDLLICRNTLMYFNAETQTRILSRFAFALAPGGYLFLGKAEMLLAGSQYFQPVDLRRRVFTKSPADDGNGRAPFPVPIVALPRREPAPTRDGMLMEAVLQGGASASLVVSPEGLVVRMNEAARALFSLSGRDLGRTLGELTLSYRPVEIRSLIEQSQSDRRTVHVRDVEWPVAGSVPRFFDVFVTPLFEPGGVQVGTLLTYQESSDRRRIRDELAQCHQERETAHEELQTTNEELQSTVEELETTNEELQSTNEELETMNEELQSTNEELRTSNEELRLRSDDLDKVSGFWKSVLGSFPTAIVVLDSELRVEVWSPQAEDMWGLRADEVLGKHFLNLDIGLPVERVRAPIRSVLSGNGDSTTVTLDARNRRGRNVRCRVVCSALNGHDGVARGAVMVMNEEADSA